MTEPYLLGIDIGTSAVKSVLIDIKGQEIAASRRIPNIIRPQPGWPEVSMEALWQDVVASIREVVHRNDVKEGSILAIGLSGMACGAWLIDSTGRPVRNAIIWNDEALGIRTEFPEDQAPQVREPIVESSKDMARLGIPNLASSGRMPIFCEAVQTIREKTRGEVFIKSTTASPFILAGHLLGIENLMMFTITQRDFLNAVLEFCSKVVLKEPHAAKGGGGVWTLLSASF